MHKAFCIFLIIAASPTAWTKKQWSKEIPLPEAGLSLTRERRQFGPGDWIPLTQPCITCRPLADNGDAGRRNEDIGLTPPRPPTVTRQVHKATFFPQDESSILSVPPPPVFNRNQIGNTNIQGTRFPNFIQQFNTGNSLQFDSQSVFPQAQFLTQPFLGSTSLLGSSYPQVLPLLNNPALLVHGNIDPTQEIKPQKINQEGKAPNLQDNVIIEQNRQQQHHVKNQQIPSPVPGLQVPLTNAPVEFAPNRQQQSILEGNILTPPPVPNSTFPDVIIPGLDKEEIQLLYVPLETLKQRANQNRQPQQQHQIHHQQVQQQQHQLNQKAQQHEGHRQIIQQQPQQIIPPQQHQVVQHQQVIQNQNQFLQPHQQQHQTVQQQQHGFQQQQIVQNQQQQKVQQHIQQVHQQQQRVTPSPQTLKFTQQQQTVRNSEHPTTPQPAGHFITHSATPAPHTVGSTLQTVPVTPTTLFFQHQPFQSSQAPVGSSTPENPTFQTFITPSPLTQKFTSFPFTTTSENLVTVPEKFQFSQEFVTTPNTIIDQVPFKDGFGKEFSFNGISHPSKFKSFSIQQQEEQQKQFLLQQQKEEEEQQKLLQQEQEKKLALEQQERERLHQEKVIREQQEREKQLKIQQEQERKQKQIKEQQERERQQKLLLQQQERERQQKIAQEQQERERQQKIIREQQERERQQKLYREQLERERQQKLAREQQERERERQQKILREQQERERQRKILLEQQERERQQKILLEQQEREKQQKLLLEQQEREYQQKLLLEQQERERQQQQILFEQQERERQEKILAEERRQKELLIKQQQEREQQLLLQEQEERQRQQLLNEQQQYLVQQQQLTQPLPTQFSLQAQEELAVTPEFEVQTEVPDESLVPHQPPLSVFYGDGKGQPRIGDVLKELKGAKTIPVLDQYLEHIPKVFVGPANLRPPKGYGKFVLPYLSNIDLNRVERKVEKLPFFVAPLNFIPPTGYSKIPFPAPHVGSVVVSTDTALQQPEKGTTPSPYLSTVRSTLHPRLRPTTQSPPTTHIQQLVPKQRIKETRFPNPLLPNPEQVNELKTESIITTTIIPETTTQSRTRRPFYRTKARRPTTVTSFQSTRSPETAENVQYQKPETAERKPNLKYPKQRRQRVKTTTENPDFDSVNSANRQFLVETSPSPASPNHFESELNKEFFQQGTDGREVQGIFEVDTRQESKVDQPRTDTVASTDFNVPTQSTLTTLGLEVVDNAGFIATTQKPAQTALQGFEATQKTPNTVDYSRFGQTDFYFTTQRTPTTVEIENAGITGFFEQTPRIPVGIESNGDSGFYNKHSFTGGDNAYFPTGESTRKDDLSNFGKFENNYFQEGGNVYQDNAGFFQQQHSSGEIQKEEVATFKHSTVVTEKPEEESIRTTQKSISFETYYPNTEATTESLKVKSAFPSQTGQDVNVQYIEIQKEDEVNPTSPPTTTTTTTTEASSRIKSRFRTKSRGQVNFATSQTSTQSPYVRKRVVYKTRVQNREEGNVNGTEEVRTVPKYRGLRKGYQTSTEGPVEYESTKSVYTVKPQRRTSSANVVRRRKTTTTERPNYPPNFNYEYSPSGVSNDVYDDQIRESSLSRNHYAENSVTYTATTSTSTTPMPVTAEVYTRRRDDFVALKTEEIPTENYPKNFPSEVYVTDISRVTPATRQSTLSVWERNEEEDLKKFQEAKKAFDPSLEKKNARRRIRVRVHKRPHEQIETAESQNFGTVANSLIPPTPAKPSSEPDLYRFSKTGFIFDQSDKFAGTKNQAYVRNITSDILENTAAFSAPGVENDAEIKKVTIVTEEKSLPTTTEFIPETTERSDVEGEKIEKDEFREVVPETTTENVETETTTYFTTVEDAETETEEPEITASTTTTTTTTPSPATTTVTDEDASREIQLSTATEISHETEICFRGKCIKTNSATADDDLRKLVQSADKVLIT